MKRNLWLVAMGLVLGLASFTAKADLQTVPFVDVNRYLGDWFQISHIRLFFEGFNDCACARQRLSALPDGRVGVLNTCTQNDGSLYSISGSATSDDAKSNSKLTVSFQGIPFKGSYWIIGLDPDYRYAVVTDKAGSALYILSRTPNMPKELYDEAVGIAARQVDISRLEITKHTGCSYPN